MLRFWVAGFSGLRNGEKYFDRHIAFLDERTRHMREILTRELGMRQLFFSFQSGFENADGIVR